MVDKHQSPYWDDERLDGEDLEAETAVAPLTIGGSAVPLALPVTLGDKITIHYPEDTPDNIRVRDNPEVWHFGGFQKDTIKLVSEKAHNRAVREADNGDLPEILGKTTEGIFRFNERVMKHAEKVEVERVEVPDFYYVR